MLHLCSRWHLHQNFKYHLPISWTAYMPMSSVRYTRRIHNTCRQHFVNFYPNRAQQQRQREWNIFRTSGEGAGYVSTHLKYQITTTQYYCACRHSREGYSAKYQILNTKTISECPLKQPGQRTHNQIGPNISQYSKVVSLKMNPRLETTH